MTRYWIYNSRNYLRLIAEDGHQRNEHIYNSRNYLRLIAISYIYD